jgi:hypothetical protein
VVTDPLPAGTAFGSATRGAGATINNIATVSAGSPTDPQPGNDSATVSTPVTKS